MTARKTHAAGLVLTALVVSTVAFAAPGAATARPIDGARVAPTRPAVHAYRTRETPAPYIRAPRPSDPSDGTFPFVWLG
ncbi:hypothetical protein [Bradyrhizobium sp. UFLA05-112]